MEIHQHRASIQIVSMALRWNLNSNSNLKGPYQHTIFKPITLISHSTPAWNPKRAVEITMKMGSVFRFISYSTLVWKLRRAVEMMIKVI